MVAEIQLLSYLYHEEVTPVDFTPSDNYSTDDQIALIAFLLNLQEYYELYQTLTIQQIYARIDADIMTLKSELSQLVNVEMVKGFENDVKVLFEKFGIPLNWFGSDWINKWIDFELVQTGFEGALNQLRDDIKSKCLYYEKFALGDVFNIAPNFKRAIKRISDVVVNNIKLARETVKRAIFKYVYGEDMLYIWVCRNDARTCAVCRAKAKEPPKRIEEWDYDHPYGRCTLKPVKEEYSEQFKRDKELM